MPYCKWQSCRQATHLIVAEPATACIRWGVEVCQPFGLAGEGEGKLRHERDCYRCFSDAMTSSTVSCADPGQACASCAQAC